MNSSPYMIRVVILIAAFVAFGTWGVNTNAQATGSMQPLPAPQAPAQAAPAAQATPTAQAPAAVPAQSPSVCGNAAYCYETADFAAVVTDFRTSADAYHGRRFIDTTLRFVNKTSQPLILGYSDGSAAALDDQSVRFGFLGGSLRGMGVVSGRNADAKFVLRPGGFGDARFGLIGANAQINGLTFEMNLTVNEITAVEGNQFVVGGEFPLQFQGLSNGVKGTAPAISAGGSSFLSGVNPMTPANGATACGPAGTVNAVATATNSAAAQNAANTATTTANNAASALSSITSIFGKKKQAPAAAPANAAATPCVPAAAATTANAPAGNVTAQPAGTNLAQPASASTTQSTVTVKAPAAAANATKTPAQPAKPATKPATTTTSTTQTQQKPQQP